MDIQPVTRRTVGGLEIKVGTRVDSAERLSLTFTFSAVCVDVERDLWNGEARFDGETVARTSAAEDRGQAIASIRSLMRSRLVEYFRE